MKFALVLVGFAVLAAPHAAVAPAQPAPQTISGLHAKAIAVTYDIAGRAIGDQAIAQYHVVVTESVGTIFVDWLPNDPNVRDGPETSFGRQELLPRFGDKKDWLRFKVACR